MNEEYDNKERQLKQQHDYFQYVMRPLKAVGRATIRVVNWTDEKGPFVTAIATVVIAILTAFYVHYSRAQWQTMRDQSGEMKLAREQAKTDNANAIVAQQTIAQNALTTSQQNFEKSIKVTTDQFHLDQRAWIGPTKMDLKPMHAPEPISAEVYIINSGKTPALRVDPNLLLHASDGPINIAEYAKHPVEKRILPPHEFTLFPNVPMIAPAETGATDELGIQSVKNGRKLLYIVGTIAYFDVFKVKHTTRFCAFYDPKLNRFRPEVACDYAD